MLLKPLRHRPAADSPLALAHARVHEAGGHGRRIFALFQAARHPGPLIWILPAHQPERPMPRGLPEGVADRLHLVTPRGGTDLLWATEEALRARAAGLVIAEPAEALSLTAGRRLQLAAEAGRTTGLLLIREGAGSNATETRWSCAPRPRLPRPGLPHPGAGPDSTLHLWSLNKNKSGTFGDWTVDWNGASAAFHLVSEAGERCEPQGAAG